MPALPTRPGGREKGRRSSIKERHLPADSLFAPYPVRHKGMLTRAARSGRRADEEPPRGQLLDSSEADDRPSRPRPNVPTGCFCLQLAAIQISLATLVTARLQTVGTASLPPNGKTQKRKASQTTAFPRRLLAHTLKGNSAARCCLLMYAVPRKMEACPSMAQRPRSAKTSRESMLQVQCG